MANKTFDTDNWRSFLIGFFAGYDAGVAEENYKYGMILNFTKNNIYVRCVLNVENNKISKLEFGREGKIESQRSWLKGVFVNDKRLPIEFLQTSFDGEEGKRYEAVWNSDNKADVLKFLQVPCNYGWQETTYRLGKDYYYKVDASYKLNELTVKETVPILSVTELEVDNAGKSLMAKFSVRVCDSFINDFRRHSETIIIAPWKN